MRTPFVLMLSLGAFLISPFAFSGLTEIQTFNPYRATYAEIQERHYEVESGHFTSKVVKTFWNKLGLAYLHQAENTRNGELIHQGESVSQRSIYEEALIYLDYTDQDSLWKPYTQAAAAVAHFELLRDAEASADPNRVDPQVSSFISSHKILARANAIRVIHYLENQKKQSDKNNAEFMSPETKANELKRFGDVYFNFAELSRQGDVFEAESEQAKLQLQYYYTRAAEFYKNAMNSKDDDGQLLLKGTSFFQAKAREDICRYFIESLLKARLAQREAQIYSAAASSSAVISRSGCIQEGTLPVAKHVIPVLKLPVFVSQQKPPSILYSRSTSKPVSLPKLPPHLIQK